MGPVRKTQIKTVLQSIKLSVAKMGHMKDTVRKLQLMATRVIVIRKT